MQTSSQFSKSIQAEFIARKEAQAAEGKKPPAQRFCVDCKHIQPGPRFDICSHPAFGRNLVSGKADTLCARARAGACGQEGRLHEPHTLAEIVQACFHPLGKVNDGSNE